MIFVAPGHYHSHYHGHHTPPHIPHDGPSARDLLKGKFDNAVGLVGLDHRHAGWMMRSFDHLNVAPGGCSVRVVRTNFRTSIILDTLGRAYTWDISPVDGRWRWM